MSLTKSSDYDIIYKLKIDNYKCFYRQMRRICDFAVCLAEGSKLYEKINEKDNRYRRGNSGDRSDVRLRA